MNILIIGAGLSGLGMGMRLKQAAIEDFIIVERADEVGGTWRDNHYPGAACDVASHLYSFSFEQSPDWSRAFGQQSEIFDYLKRCTDKYDLRPHVYFNTTVQGARFDARTGLWTVETNSGERLTARIVISAVGALADPAYPDIRGLDRFAGKLMHTARWDHDYDLAGRRVAVIGSGASAIQVVPKVAVRAAQLSVFQRTPNWILPRPDRRIPDDEQAAYRKSAGKLFRRRLYIYWLHELLAPFIISNLPPLKTVIRQAAKSHIRRQVKHPAVRRRLIPDYEIGCKRILLSNDWYPALQRDNVALETAGIARIVENGIVTRDGRIVEVDAIVCATGFRVPNKGSPYPVTGRDGRDLNEAWRDGAEAYKGVTVSGFPNLFFLMGPNAGPGHTSVLAFTEQQMGYVLQAIQHMRRRGLKFVDVKQQVQDRFNRNLQRRMKYTAWTSGCNSWYLTERGKNTALYPGFNWEYRLRLWRFVAGDYDAARLDKGAGTRPLPEYRQRVSRVDQSPR